MNRSAQIRAVYPGAFETPRRIPDATVENHGSLTLIRPHTRAARDWIRDNVEDTAHYFGAALAVEPRYVPRLVEGMIAAGLVIA